MSEQAAAGYEERAHTADLSLLVWGDTLETLFIQAALGMYAFIQPVFIDDVPPVEERLRIEGIDADSLLVAFLSELVYWLEDKRVAFSDFQIRITGQSAAAHCVSRPVRDVALEIKAVTYSELEIKKTSRGWETVVVFDI